MNGFIATLLSLMMTGMAVTQQPQSFNDPLVPNSGPTASLLGKYLLVIDDDLVNGLIAQGYLSSPINADVRSSIDHIVFHGSDQNSLRADIEPIRIQPILSKAGSTTLQFLLSDQDLRTMRERGLRYIIHPNERGRFSEVAVLYDPPFIGPQLPDNWEYRNPANQQLQTSDDSFRPRLGSVATRPSDFDTARNQTSFTDTQVQGNFNTQRYSTTDTVPRLNGENGFAANSGFGVDPGKREEFRTRDAQQLEWQQLAQENDELKQKLQEFEIQQARSNREPPFASTGNPAIRDEYDYPYHGDTRSPIRNPTGSYPTRYADNQVFVNSLNQSDGQQMPPDRIAASPRPTNGLLPFAIASPDTNASTPQTATTAPQTIDQKILADNELTQKQNWALWFIMFCSVGLNFYLSWIARGFYVRYEELAEEIRESFTTTS